MVTVTFSEQVLEVSSANTGAHVLYSDDGTDPTNAVSSLSPALAGDGKSYSFTLGSEPAAGKIIKVKIDADTFQDTSLNKMAAMTEAVASNPVPASGDLTVEGSTTITVSGQAKGDVVIDPSAGTVTENGDAVAVESSVATAMATATELDVSGTGFESEGTITLNNVPVATLTVKTSDLATTTVNWVKDGSPEAFIIGGSASKPASTVVTGLDSTDTVTGTFTAGELEVTAGKIGLGTNTVKVFADAGAAYKGDITTVLADATTLALDATAAPAAMDLSTITGWTKLDLDNGTKAFNVSMTSSAYDTLVTTPANLTAGTEDTITLTDATEIALGKFVADYKLDTASAGTATVGTDTTYSATALFGDNIKALNVTTGILTDAAAASVTKFDATGYSLTVASGATLSTEAPTVTLGSGGTLSLGGTLAMTGTTANTLNGTATKAITVGTLTSAAALTLDSKQAAADDGSSITVTTLTGKDGGAALTTAGTVTASNVTNVNALNGADSTTVNDVVSLTFKTGNTLELAVNMKKGGDALTLSGDRGTATVTVNNGDTVTGAITSGDADNVAAADVYTGLKAGDIIKTNATFSSTTVGTELLTTPDSLAAAAVKGTYSDGTFTAGASGPDYLLQWDDGTNGINSIVLIGVSGLTVAAPNGNDITLS